jgi:cyanophycinase-like exopeptidase
MNILSSRRPRAGRARERLVLSTFVAAALAALSSALSAATVVQAWEFNQSSGTSLSASANAVSGGSSWNSALTGVTQNGSGSLRFAYDNSSTVYRYAALGANPGGIYTTTVVFTDWDILNGSNTSTSRPRLELGFRSAASSSSSLVADVQFIARAAGVQLAVRDSASDFILATLPSSLPNTLTVSLTVNKSVTPNTYTLAYSIAGGVSATFNGTLSSISSGRAINQLCLAALGNFPYYGDNLPPLIDRIQVAYGAGSTPPPPPPPPPGDGVPPPPATRAAKPSGLVTYLTGNNAYSTKTPVNGPGVLLMGGGSEVDAAFVTDAYPVANGGDVVVLRTTGTNGYNAYLYTDIPALIPAAQRPALQPDSIETLIVDSVAKANSAYVAEAVTYANLIFIAGGDQSAYLNFWKSTALETALRNAYARGAVIGGTSAGMAVNGEWIYDPDGVTAATSATAVANPYNSAMLFSTDFLDLPIAFDVVAETHFANRDRMGRVLAFMARLRQDGAPAITGVALDEGTSFYINPARLGTFRRQGTTGAGYILRESAGTQRVRVTPGQSLIYRNVLRTKLTTNGDTFNLTTGASNRTATTLSVEGAPPPSPY